ncbi:isochorismate synthase [Geminisphaera colitermitum]|uniref:isochorismate synthase n=1 Tax=Geminisphaera colitermitum TaxID=1148786 RepID=UPI00069482FE|nr:isochorismate synthase [Geminisphaera colitermitum]
MILLPIHPAENATPQALGDFLARCHAEAVRDGHPRLASISLAVDALDPLAVLESIFEPGEPHFYTERPGMESALAGAEIAIAHTASGSGRFDAIRRFIDDTLARTIAVGDVTAPFGGPHFFTTFSFLDDVEPGDPFAAAHVFVPRWQVARAAGVTTAVANLLISPAATPAELAALTDRVWRAHAKFAKFDYRSSEVSMIESGAGVPPASEKPAGGTPAPHSQSQTSGRDARATATHSPPPYPTLLTTEVSDYRLAVTRSLADIAAGRYQKIVLARARDLVAPMPFHPLRVLNTLRERFPECYSFSVANGHGQSFIGASPERLVRVSQGVIETEALAGSIRRGQSASDDAALGSALLASEKDLREHRHVLDSILRRLAPLDLVLPPPPPPALRKLANVQHLHTPVRAPLPDGVHLLDILARLHPTPAVGGTPRDVAVARIRELEGFPRGLYAGAIGWIDARGGGEFFVGLRSALIQGNAARIYAGAGIVAGSDPETEYAETDLKFRALHDALTSI